MRNVVFCCALFLSVLCLASDRPYGFCYHLGYSKKSDATIKKELASLRSAGAEWIRTDLSWPWQPRSKKTGAYGFENIERALKLAEEADLRVLLIINRCPASMEPLHEHLDEWSDFIRQAVARFKGRVTHWEIWNEENFRNERRWGSKDTEIHAKNYAACLKAAFKAVKGADPNAVVLYGGTSHVPLDFIEATLAFGAGKSFDVMNVHPYNTGGMPEDNIASDVRQLRLLMDRYGLSRKPIWATEIGWSTSPQKSSGIYARVLPPAFDILGIDAAKVPLTAVDGVWSPIRDYTKHFPPFARLEIIKGDDIAKLDPERNPVLLPMSGETFAHHRQDMLLEYVRRGGVIILPKGYPFATLPKMRDESGLIREGSVADIRRKLGMFIEFPWTARHPYCTNIAFSANGPISEDFRYRCARYLTDKWTEKGDSFTPVLWAREGSFQMPIAGVYKYRTSLKGAAIVVTEPGSGVQPEISEANQARFIVRAHLIGLSSGYDRIFWYQFVSSSSGRENPDLEANYGISYTAPDGKPEERPAYASYRTLTQMMPPGSKMSKLGEGSSSRPYSVSWMRNDGRKVVALWMKYGESEYRVAGCPVAIVDIYGNQLPVSNKILVGMDVVYLVY